MFLVLAIELVPALVPVVVLVNLIDLVLVPAQEWVLANHRVLGRVVVVGQVLDWFVELARIGVFGRVGVVGQVPDWFVELAPFLVQGLAIDGVLVPVLVVE
jgi:hypothetical protein